MCLIAVLDAVESYSSSGDVATLEQIVVVVWRCQQSDNTILEHLLVAVAVVTLEHLEAWCRVVGCRRFHLFVLGNQLHARLVCCRPLKPANKPINIELSARQYTIF